jgi:hypothetical protein
MRCKKAVIGLRLGILLPLTMTPTFELCLERLAFSVGEFVPLAIRRSREQGVLSETAGGRCRLSTAGTGPNSMGDDLGDLISRDM